MSASSEPSKSDDGSFTTQSTSEILNTHNRHVQQPSEKEMPGEISSGHQMKVHTGSECAHTYYPLQTISSSDPSRSDNELYTSPSTPQGNEMSSTLNLLVQQPREAPSSKPEMPDMKPNSDCSQKNDKIRSTDQLSAIASNESNTLASRVGYDEQKATPSPSKLPQQHSERNPTVKAELQSPVHTQDPKQCLDEEVTREENSSSGDTTCNTSTCAIAHSSPRESTNMQGQGTAHKTRVQDGDDDILDEGSTSSFESIPVIAIDISSLTHTEIAGVQHKTEQGHETILRNKTFQNQTCCQPKINEVTFEANTGNMRHGDTVSFPRDETYSRQEFIVQHDVNLEEMKTTESDCKEHTNEHRSGPMTTMLTNSSAPSTIRAAKHMQSEGMKPNACIPKFTTRAQTLEQIRNDLLVCGHTSTDTGLNLRESIDRISSLGVQSTAFEDDTKIEIKPNHSEFFDDHREDINNLLIEVRDFETQWNTAHSR